MSSALAQAASILFWMALGAVGIWAGARLNIGSLAAPEAGLMPALAGGALVVFAALALWQTLLAGRRGRREAQPAAGRQRVAAPLAAVVLLAFYAAFFEKVGFVPGTFVLIVLLARLLGNGGWISALLLGAAASGASYAVFKLALGVPLP